MNNLSNINSILSEKFRIHEKILEEKKEKMKITFDTRNGCSFLSYKYDDNLKDYKGGLFPFFTDRIEGVHSIVDYIIFTEQGNTIYVIVFELKKGRKLALPQFKAAEKFINFIIETANRINNISINYKIRYVSVKEFQIEKGKTMQTEIKYDKYNHFELKHNNFCLNSFIK